MASLLSQIFWTHGVKKKTLADRQRPKINQLKLHCCFARFRTRDKRILELGEESIGREFEIVNFIKLQKRLRTMLSVIFSKKEKLILSKTRKLYLSET
jgi:hypothetical protein